MIDPRYDRYVLILIVLFLGLVEILLIPTPIADDLPSLQLFLWHDQLTRP